MNFSDVSIPSARSMHDIASTGALNPRDTLFDLIAEAIISAANSGNFTSTTDIASNTSADIQSLLNVLHTNGYTTVLTPSGIQNLLTINW